MEEDKKPDGLKRKFYFWFNIKSRETHVYIGKPYDEYCFNFDLPFFGFGYAY